MVLQGAELLLYPTAIGSEPQNPRIDSRRHWQRAMQGHSASNIVPVLASNRIGCESECTVLGKHEFAMTFYGTSFIADETGEVVAEAREDEESILHAHFDLDKIRDARAAWGLFRDRRPPLYTRILTLDGAAP
jgi:N-carbamoylputrescine amidase